MFDVGSSVEVNLQLDQDGYLFQECPYCHWRFKILGSILKQDGYECCPYCANTNGDFCTEDQIEYFKQVVTSQQILPLLKKFSSKLTQDMGLIQLKASYRANPVAVQPKESDIAYNMVNLDCCQKQIKLDNLHTGIAYCPFCGKEFNHETNTQVAEMKKYRQFQRSYTQLKEFAENVARSNYKIFETNLKIFVHHLEQDQYLSPVAAQLNSHPDYFFQWWQKLSTSRTGMGSADINLPTDQNERLTLLYQLCTKIVSGEITITSFGVTLFSRTNLNEMIQDFCEQLFTPMVQLLKHKIDEIDDALREEKDILNSDQAYHQIIYNTINVSGDNTGAIVTGNDNIVKVINNSEDFISELTKLYNHDDIKHNDEAKKVLKELIEYTQTGTDKTEAVNIVSRMISSAPSVKDRFAKLIGSVSTGLAGNVIFEAIKFLI